MHKIFLIIQREFLSRVKKRSFLIATLLVPILIPTLIGGMIYFAVQQEKNVEQRTIHILDESNLFEFETSSRYNFIAIAGPIDKAKEAFNESDDFALIYIPEIDIENPKNINFYAKSSPGVSLVAEFEKNLETQIRDIKLTKSGLSEEILAKLKTSVSIQAYNLADGKEKKSDSILIFGVAYLVGFMIYGFLIFYGTQVMHGVIEEKNSKIVEVIVSTVKPFHLMMGKVVGVASVGLFQFLIWMVLMGTFSSIATGYFGLDMPQQQAMEHVTQNLPDNEQALEAATPNPKLQEIYDNIKEIPILKISLLFIFYFIGGYFLYAALFAAVGSAVDTPADAQQFMLPITLPIIIGLLGMIMFVSKDPNSSVSFWLSVIPFTSPVVMMGRVGFGVPTWEIVLSMVLLIVGFTFTIWLAGRIYRIGILMHGAKVNYKVLAKWLMMKN